jgi:hypothetical protein
MTFQYIRRRPHIPCYGNPFATDWSYHNGMFSATNWNLFYWDTSPEVLYNIREIYGRPTIDQMWFRVSRIDGKNPDEIENKIWLGAIRHKSTGKLVTVEELLRFKDLL